MPPFAHFVLSLGYMQVLVPADGRRGDARGIRRSATLADMPVSVSTQLVPSVFQSTVWVWAEEQVPSAGPPDG